MKKLGIFILIIVIILTGCSIGKKESVKKADNDYYQFEKDYTYKSKVSGYNTNKIKITNYSPYEFDEDIIYGFYQEDKMIYSLDFVNYIENFEEMFDDETKFKYDDKKKIWYAIYDKYELAFDFKNNEIRFDDIALIDSMFKAGESGEKILKTSEELYEYGDLKTVKESEKLVIKLDDYNMELVEKDGAFLVPAHLLQFVLSAYDYKLYFNGEDYFYKDVFSDGTYSVDTGDYQLNEAEYAYANQFNKIIFDNFYGLQELHPTLSSDLEKTTDINGFSDNYREFISDLDDGHTSILDFMYMGDSELTNNEYAKTYNRFNEYERVGCYELFSDDAKDFNVVKASDKTAILEIYSLSSDDFANEYFEQVESIKDYENIVLDIRCNGGGYMLNSYVLFYPFTNEPITETTGDIYGGKYSEEMTKKNNEIISDANLYLVTSDLTFSAANYSASIAKDNNFAKIIGETSGGGTAAVGVYSSPNGAVMMFSSGNSLLYNNQFSLIENGIDVDISYTFKNNQNAYLNDQFSMSKQYYQDIALLVESS